MNLKPLRRSSCIAFHRFHNHLPQLLVQKRKSELSYARTFTFPGGVLQSTDLIFEELSWHQNSKFTALRQAYEETGLVLVERGTRPEQVAGWKQEQVLSKIREVLWANREEIMPAMRCLSDHYTAQKSRYDTIYFMHSRKLVPFNIKKYFRTSRVQSVHDLDQFFISSEELSEVFWINPLDWIKMFKQSKTQMYLTHLAVSSVVLNATSQLDLENRIEQLRVLQDKYFPYVMQFDGKVFLMPPDRFFDYKQFLAEEPASESKSQIEGVFGNIDCGQICRLIINFKDLQMTVVIALKQRTILQYFNKQPTL